MNPSVKQLFQSLEYQREYLFSLCKELPSNKTNLQLDTNSWSIGQVYYHLFLVEKLTFEDISKRLKNYQSAQNTGLSEKVKMVLLKMALRLPFKFKAPRVVSAGIPKEVDLDKLSTDWAALRQSFELLLNVNSDEQLRLKLFKQPRIGFINVIQALEFIKVHHKHHLPQIRNLLSKIDG